MVPDNLPESEARVLAACLYYAETEPLPESERVICYSWINRVHTRRHNAVAPRKAFNALIKAGWLKKADSARGGSRRYYTLAQ